MADMHPVSIQDLNVSGKRVLVRVDFNVPLNEKNEITNDMRIKAALPTIQYLIDKGARVIIASHLGRPKGKVQEKFRLNMVAQRLSKLLGRTVIKANDCIGQETKQMAEDLRPGEVLLLENVRFHPEEEKNDPLFARQLADLADLYVNDAFGTAHRAHASTVGITAYLPSAVGFLMQQELEALGKVLHSPDRPLLAIIGGAKVSDKIKLVDNLLEKADFLALGGGMANTFLKAKGLEVGRSLVEEDYLDFARKLIVGANRVGVQLLFPIDVVIADRIDAEAEIKTVFVEDVPSDWMILDIGPETIKQLERVARECKTIFWNGPMGVFEVKSFARGTYEVARVLAESPALTVVGGGDSVTALEETGLSDRITHVSTGGGASLEFLEGRGLPGVAALMARDMEIMDGRIEEGYIQF